MLCSCVLETINIVAWLTSFNIWTLYCLRIFIIKISSWFLILIVPDELTSVYFGNLPANATEAEIDQEFKNFGRIKPDGIFIRVRKVAPLFGLHWMLIYPSMKKKKKKTKVEIDVCRKLESAMHLLNLKTLLVFKMHFRFVVILFILFCFFVLNLIFIQLSNYWVP